MIESFVERKNGFKNVKNETITDNINQNVLAVFGILGFSIKSTLLGA